MFLLSNSSGGGGSSLSSTIILLLLHSCLQPSDAIDCYVCGNHKHNAQAKSCLEQPIDVEACDDEVTTCLNFVEKEEGKEPTYRKHCGNPAMAGNECSDEGDNERMCHCDQDLCNKDLLNLADNGSGAVVCSGYIVIPLGGLLAVIARLNGLPTL